VSAYLALEAYDPARTKLELITAAAPGANPTIVTFESDWGAALWEQSFSGPRGTLGRRSAGQQLRNREGRIVIRIYGSAKDNVAARLSALHEQWDLIRRFGGRVTRRDHGQTYRQHLDVLGTEGAIPQWTPQLTNRDVATVTLPAQFAPYALGDPLDIDDQFTVDTLADYTFDAGAPANVTVTGGALDAVANLTTENRLIHTALGYTYSDHQVTVSFAPGATISSFKAGCIIKRVDASNYFEAYVDDNGTNSRIRLDKIIGGSRTNIGSINVSRISNGTLGIVRGRIERNKVIAEYHFGQLKDVRDVSATTVTYTLTTGEQATFGAEQAGRGGIVWTPQDTDAAIYQFEVTPYTYRRTSLPEVFRLNGVPGDAPALVDVTLTATDRGSQQFAIVGWMPAAPAVNLVDTSDEFGANGTRGWAIAAVTNINADATSITSEAATPPKWAANALRVTAVSGNADSGASRRVWRRFRQGHTYTFRAWVKAPSGSTANVAARVGNSAANDVATGSNVALSSGWQLVTVAWTPTADRADAHITVIRRTSGAADVFEVDGEQVYEGTTAPTLPSQIEGRGGVAPFGVLEAENGSQVFYPVTADSAASAGSMVRTSAVARVDPNVITPDDDGADTALVEVWGRLRLGGSFTSIRAKANVRPYLNMQNPDTGESYFSPYTWSLEHGEAGRPIVTPQGVGLKSRIIRFGTLPIPVRNDESNYVVQAKLDYVPGSLTSTAAKTSGGSEAHTLGTWANPTNANALDAAYTTPAALGNNYRWKTYAFGLPGGATIAGIEVRVTAKQSAAGGGDIGIQLSWDTGTTVTTARSVTEGNLDIVLGEYVVGGPEDLWGRSWVDTEFSDTNFRLVLHDWCDPGVTPQVDLVTVKVYYSTATDVAYIDWLLLVGGRRRAVTKTGVDPPKGTALIPYSANVEVIKRVDADLSGHLSVQNYIAGQGGRNTRAPGYALSSGLGGALIEIPPGNTDVVVATSNLVPDAPTSSLEDDEFGYFMSVRFSVTPRWAILRDV
jgi:hypothetical protein